MSTMTARAARHARSVALPAAAALFAFARGAGAQTLARQWVDERLDTLMGVIDQQPQKRTSAGPRTSGRRTRRNGRDKYDATSHATGAHQSGKRRRAEREHGPLFERKLTLDWGIHLANKHLTIGGAVSIGLTPNAPNSVVGMRFPYTL
jgi:hypothetical protein